MTVVLEVIGVIIAFWVVLSLVVFWWLARRNRVGRGARTGAPMHWLVAPSRAANAHRRLRRAVATARAALDGTGPEAPARSELAACVAALERQAIDLDHRLVVAATCPPTTRWTLVSALNPQVADVERIAARLAAVAVLSPTDPRTEGGLDALDARLAALSAARAELDALDAAPAVPGCGNPGDPAAPLPTVDAAAARPSATGPAGGSPAAAGPALPPGAAPSMPVPGRTPADRARRAQA
jgi:hypothetical protein